MLENTELVNYWRSHGVDPDRCFYTGWPLGGVVEADYLIPFARGGQNTMDNIVPCLPAVKQAKQHRTAEEFLAYLDADDPELGIAV